MTLSRRSLITGLASFIAAPAIVRASSLMPVKALLPAVTMPELIEALIPAGAQYRTEFIRTFEQHYDSLTGGLVREWIVDGRGGRFEIVAQS